METYLKMVLLEHGKVFLCTKPKLLKSNSYELNYNAELTDKYRREGLIGLDGEIIRLLYGTYVIDGDHPSVTKYRYALASLNPAALNIFQRYTKELADQYKKLSEAERNHIWNPVYSSNVQNYKAFEQEFTNQMYAELAILVQKFLLEGEKNEN